VLAGFPEVKILNTGGEEIEISYVGKKVSVEFCIPLLEEQ
jgi:hypothetical protein